MSTKLLSKSIPGWVMAVLGVLLFVGLWMVDRPENASGMDTIAALGVNMGLALGLGAGVWGLKRLYEAKGGGVVLVALGLALVVGSWLMLGWKGMMGVIVGGIVAVVGAVLALGRK